MKKITGNGRPHTRLVGEVGQHYEDLNTGDIYECRIASQYSPTHGWPVGGYVWELRAKGEDIREIYGGVAHNATTVSIPLYNLDSLTRDQRIQFAKELKTFRYLTNYGVNTVYDYKAYTDEYEDCGTTYITNKLKAMYMGQGSKGSVEAFVIEITDQELNDIRSAWNGMVISA